jgi:hypothetical protein
MTDTIDIIIDTVDITKIEERAAGGTWVIGTFEGYEFQALVFSEHAECESYELHNSRISKLWIRRNSNDKTVFNFDRGLDINAIDDSANAIVGFLCSGLAEFIFGE